ncbi:MAG: hypothetical protein ABIA66_03555, partial [Candidatus Omnitrophota bacterium]
ASDEADKEIGRYQVYSTDKFVVMLDTKSGKLWKLNADMSGKVRAEGATVEGLAHSSSDLDALSAKIGRINLDAVPEKNKAKCREDLVNDFSYALDAEKIDKIITAACK